MEKRIYICDKCRKEAEPGELWNKPEGWKSVTLKWGQYDSHDLLLCDECCERLGVPVMKQVNGNTSPDDRGTAEKLYDIIAEIVAEQNRG